MAIDPVVLLAEELRKAERALEDAHRVKAAEASRRLLARIAFLTEELYETDATSAVGAAEMLKFAERFLPQSGTNHGEYLRQIEERLADGRRRFADLVWLRGFSQALHDGACGDEGTVVAPLVDSALHGAARPVLVYRASEVRSRKSDVRDQPKPFGSSH